jgi:Domain of unknown function (DUF4864)
MLRCFFAALFMGMVSLGAFAEPPSSAEGAEFQRIITAQISAFQADDGSSAYGFAAPVVRRIFPTVDGFMAMVKKGYPQVYRPQSFTFKETLTDPLGRPAQKVMIVGPNGKTYVAVYTMEKQVDGSWLISGCTMLEIPGLDA